MKTTRIFALMGALIVLAIHLSSCGGGSGGPAPAAAIVTPAPTNADTTIVSQLAKADGAWKDPSEISAATEETIWRYDKITASGDVVTVQSVKINLVSGVSLVPGSIFFRYGSNNTDVPIADQATSTAQPINIGIPAGGYTYVVYAIKGTQAGSFSPTTVLQTSIGEKSQPITLTITGTTPTNAPCTDPNGNHGDTRTVGGCALANKRCNNGVWEDISGAPTSCGPTNHNPVINSANATPASGIAPLQTTFNVSATDPDGDTPSYSLSFGDNTTNASGTGSGIMIPHTYATAGSYTATVTVTDGKGGTTTSNLNITVSAVAQMGIVTVTSNEWMNECIYCGSESYCDDARFSFSHSMPANTTCRVECTPLEDHTVTVSLGPTLLTPSGLSFSCTYADYVGPDNPAFRAIGKLLGQN